MIKKIQKYYPMILMFFFTNGIWITDSIRIDFILIILIMIPTIFKVFYKFRINHILLLLTVMFISGTIFGFVLGNNDYRLFMTAYDSYLRIFIGLKLAIMIHKEFTFNQIVKYVVYILALPTYFFSILWLMDVDFAEIIITELFSPKRNDWHRFSGIFGLPYLASTFVSINLFCTIYLLITEKKRLILFILLILLIIIGGLTFSRTFLLGVICSILFIFFYYLVSIKFKHYVILGIIFTSFIVLINKFPEMSRIETLSLTGIYDTIFLRYSLESSQSSSIKNILEWNWFYGLGMGKSYAAMDSFYVENFSFFGIFGPICFTMILFHFFRPIFFTNNLPRINKLFFFFLLLFLTISGIGSSSFTSDRSEVLIWTLISFGYINSFGKPINRLRNDYVKASY